MDSYLYIKTVGSVRRTVAEHVAHKLAAIFPFEIKIAEERHYPLAAFEPRRNQYYAKKIIENLLCDIPADCEKLLGITDVDLCTPVLQFVFGEAQLDGRVAVVSCTRLRQEFHQLPADETIFLERLIKECVHELGHCYGLYHCSNTQCAMFFSGTIFTIDSKRGNFCQQCRHFLDEKIGREYNV
jgi:archaemetzincin